MDSMPVCSHAVDGQKHWWCNKCKNKDRWTNSHHTAQHDPDFSFNKKANKKKVKFQGQANLGEGLTPRCNLWLAKVRTQSCKPKNHFGQQPCKLRKQFGRRFNNVIAWMKKRKRCFNRLKSKPMLSCHNLQTAKVNSLRTLKATVHQTFLPSLSD